MVYMTYMIYGEFDQKGSIPTKYGTKDEYLKAIRILKGNNIKPIADIVFNHRLGADETEEVIAIEDDQDNRNISIGKPQAILAWTKYNFPRKK